MKLFGMPKKQRLMARERDNVALFKKKKGKAKKRKAIIDNAILKGILRINNHILRDRKHKICALCSLTTCHLHPVL